MSTPDPLDQESEQLFAALREERVPEGSEERALRAACAELAGPRNRMSSRQALWGGVCGALAVAAAVAFAVRPDPATSRISAEPAREARRAVASRPVSSAESAAAPAASDVTPMAPLAPRPHSTPAPSQSAPATLGDELAALKGASAALNAGDGAGALSALDRYERVLKGKQLRAEATLLRIQALSQTGQAGAASALAKQFVDRNPDSPLVDRARSYVK